jgi:hypothetical protein
MIALALPMQPMHHGPQPPRTRFLARCGRAMVRHRRRVAPAPRGRRYDLACGNLPLDARDDRSDLLGREETDEGCDVRLLPERRRVRLLDEQCLELPDALDLQPTPNAGHCCPDDAARSPPFGHAGPPGAVLVPAMASPLADDDVGAREDPVERSIMVGNAFKRAANIREQAADRLPAVGQPPFGEIDLRVLGEEVEDAAAARG